MSAMRLVATLVVATAALFAAPREARAAASHDNCKGFVTALPATITTPGTWCLAGDLELAQDFYTAIDIQSNDVTLDCNDHQIAKTGAPAEWSAGIAAYARRRVVVRNCTVRGFKGGITLAYEYSHDFSPWGNLVEDNVVVDGNEYGILVEGDGSMVRRNRVSGIHEVYARQPYGIGTRADVDVIDNTVERIVPTSQGALGISTAAVARGNRVRLDAGVAGVALAIGETGVAVGNDLVGGGVPTDNQTGIACSWYAPNNRVQDNIVAGFSEPTRDCPASETDDIFP